jgi:hypothetical protein
VDSKYILGIDELDSQHEGIETMHILGRIADRGDGFAFHVRFTVLPALLGYNLLYAPAQLLSSSGVRKSGTMKLQSKQNNALALFPTGKRYLSQSRISRSYLLKGSDK